MAADIRHLKFDHARRVAPPDTARKASFVSQRRLQGITRRETEVAGIQ
jgi:hypothetical protein